MKKVIQLDHNVEIQLENIVQINLPQVYAQFQLRKENQSEERNQNLKNLWKQKN
jgi:hypothetical protein